MCDYIDQVLELFEVGLACYMPALRKDVEPPLSLVERLS